MIKLAEILSTDVHELRIDGETKRIQIVPQIVSTLRRELFLWNRASQTSSGPSSYFRNF